MKKPFYIGALILLFWVSSVSAFGLGFDSWISYDVGSNPFSVYASDFNGDGKVDLAVANSGSSTVSILLGNGDGTFAAKVDYGTGSGPRSVYASDFNGDGKVDLATANENSNTVSVLLGNGDGTFAAKVDYGTGSFPRSVYASDFDGDGDQDLTTANGGSNTVSVLKNLSVVCVAKPGDANGDGKVLLPDIVVIINFLFKSAPAPNPLCRVDANGNGTVLLPDIVYLINFLFKSGPAPVKSGVCCL